MSETLQKEPSLLQNTKGSLPGRPPHRTDHHHQNEPTAATHLEELVVVAVEELVAVVEDLVVALDLEELVVVVEDLVVVVEDLVVAVEDLVAVVVDLVLLEELGHLGELVPHRELVDGFRRPGRPT